VGLNAPQGKWVSNDGERIYQPVVVGEKPMSFRAGSPLCRATRRCGWIRTAVGRTVHRCSCWVIGAGLKSGVTRPSSTTC